MHTLMENLRLRIHASRCEILLRTWNRRAYQDNVSRLYYVEQAGAWVVHDGRKYPLRPGRLHLIPAQTVFDYGCEKAFRQHWLHFNALALGESEIFTFFRCNFDVPADQAVTLPLLRKLEALFPQPGLAARMEAHSLLLRLLARFFTRAEAIAHPAGRDLSQAVVYLREHLGESLRVEELAARFHLERSHFTRLFAQQFGQAPARYLRRLRVECSCQLLAQTEDTLTAIADRLGFSDAFHFSKAFKRLMGMSPRDFRRMGGVLP